MTGQAFADVYRGQIPSSIHKMQSLQEFSTNLINLGGTIPPEIFSLPTLTTLYVPCVFCNPLAYLTNYNTDLEKLTTDSFQAQSHPKLATAHPYANFPFI